MMTREEKLANDEKWLRSLAQLETREGWALRDMFEEYDETRRKLARTEVELKQARAELDQRESHALERQRLSAMWTG
jgi:hypothetical protein